MSWTTKILAQNLFAYGASEVASKASRLLVVIAVARSLELTEIGLAAAAFAAGDVLKSVTENGVGQRIIAARDADLAATCATAHRIFWAWCVGLFAVQIAIGAAIFATGGSAMLFALITILAAEYLSMPAGLVQAALAMRSGKLRATAGIAGAQVVGANLISAALVFVWPSAIALVLPRLLAAPIWLIAMRRLHPWQREVQAGFAPLRPFIQFGWAVLGVEIVKALRLQADKIIVGAFMGADALGLYFMAFNAGLSLSNAFSTAFSTVLFPYLSRAQNKAIALRQSMLLGLGLISPAVLIQYALAPIYVPILFGPGWDEVAGIVAVLCLVAIPTTLWSAAAGWLRSQGRPQSELIGTIGITLGLVCSTVLLVPYGLLAVATGYAVACFVLMSFASLPVILASFGPTPEKV
ncbi:oligosaccharide flippase family protein [Yoonia sp. SS1-5]|uniref:Oligosaccharide flippase family protein n=1 Tax=Yoonia rhodophyticola TaxID=3137370 RepID=A0AAN0MAT7_9RHOB